MTLLPIALPTTPPNGAAAGDVTATSGDFAALLAVVAGMAPLPPNVPMESPEEATSPAAAPAPPGPPAAAPAQRLPTEASQTPLAEAMLPPPVEMLAPPPVQARQVEDEGSPLVIDRPRAEVVPPARSRPVSPTVPASPVAVEASPALTRTFPVSTPAPDTSGPLDAEAVVMPLGAPPRSERPAVRVPASPVAVEASPALIPQLGAADVPLNPEHPVQEDPPGHRIPEKPVPEVTAPAPTSWPAAATRAQAPIPADAPAAAAPVAPPAIPEQIVSAVVPLHGRGDGRHEVTLELHPVDLGTIRVEVSVEHQTVHLTLHAAEPATAQLLSAGLADLRAALADAGLNAGQVAVSPDGGTGSGRRSRPQTDAEPGPPGRPTPRSNDPATTSIARPVSAGRLDLFL